MMRRASLTTIALTLLPAFASAQSLTGAAEWTVARGTTQSDDQPYVNDSLWQRYTLDLQAPLFDPRLLKYDAGLSFRTNSLTYGATDAAQQGHQDTFGYKLGAIAFPARPFPFFIEASRDAIGESGDYPSTAAIRGGIVVPAGVPLPDFRTRNETLNAGWQLTAPNLPRVELGYRSGTVSVTGGPYEARQDNDSLQLGVFKDQGRVHQSLRYQRSSFSNLVTDAFDQRLSDLDYELGVLLGARSRLQTRAGRRNTFSQFDLPPHVVDPGTVGYRPPSRGEVSTLFVTSGITYDPAARLSISVTGNADRQEAEPIATSALLATTTARYDVFHGLSVDASGTYGQRGEAVGDVPVTVVTQTTQAAATYRAGAQWLQGTVSYRRGIGSNSALDGRVGEIRSGSEQGQLSSTVGWLTLMGGYEHQNNTDEILDFGNYDVRRFLGSVQTLGRVLSLMANWDESDVTRGREATLGVNHQQTFSGSAAYQIGRNSRLAATAGGFSNRAEIALEPTFDRTLFWGGTYESAPWPRLHLSASLRREETTASQTHLDQRGWRGFAQAEYRLRLFQFALEYRDDQQRLQDERAPKPFNFKGRQVLLRITRKFGMRL
jgi:hypothetical protein